MERPLARAIFWVAATKLAWTQVGYGLALAALRRARGNPPVAPGGDVGTPLVSLIVAAYDEERVIAAKVENALALDWPRDRLEIVVAVDGGADPGADATAERARAAGADLVLELPRGGKVRAQDAAVAAARGTLLAFSDANAVWEPGALRALVTPFADPGVGYVCGQVRFVNAEGTNQEALYWRYEMWLRAGESALESVTAGNGAIYALRREAYMHVNEVMGHDLSFPFNVVKRGRRAVYASDARATEKMVPTIEGEGARKRRMMSHAWAIVLRGGMLSPRGYPPLYALMIASHRVLRYASPLLHVAAAAATLALLRQGRAYRAAALAQAGLLAAAAAGGSVRLRPSARRPLLRRDHGCTRRRPLRPPAPRHGGGVGGRGGHAVSYRGKRALDVTVAAVVLAAGSPALAVAALLIRLESEGHPIYRQRRVGRDGVPFELYKLRTMVSGAETMGAGLAIDVGDSRITRLGAILRRTSLDELPNLVNVLRGEMSIVGPRPTVQVQVDRYTPRQRGRLSVPPGLTGWAQIQGRASLPWSERIELDLWYVEHASLALDLRILWRTVRMVVSGHGLYKGETGGWSDPPRSS